MASGLFVTGQGESVVAFRRMISRRVFNSEEHRSVSLPRISCRTAFNFVVAVLVKMDSPEPRPPEHPSAAVLEVEGADSLDVHSQRQAGRDDRAGCSCPAM